MHGNFGLIMVEVKVLELENTILARIKKDGCITSYIYVCCKEGMRKLDKRDFKTNNPRLETRTGYAARMNDDHYHPLHPPETVHLLPSQRKITNCQAYDLEMVEQAGIQQNA